MYYCNIMIDLQTEHGECEQHRLVKWWLEDSRTCGILDNGMEVTTWGDFRYRTNVLWHLRLW